MRFDGIEVRPVLLREVFSGLGGNSIALFQNRDGPLSGQRPFLESETPQQKDIPHKTSWIGEAQRKMGAKWTFKDLFHLEMFVLTDEANLDIFGDEECRDDWREEHGDDNCANTWWLCIGNSSEYDYYYVNAKEDSPDFGQVRHIVNNCDEESIYTQAPFDNFLDAVERYVDAQERLQTDSDDEGKNFSEYNRAPNGCKPRKRLRL